MASFLATSLRGVEPALVDDDRLRLVVGTSPLNQGGGFVVSIHVYCNGILWLAVAQHLGHVLAYKEGLALLVDDDRPTLVVRTTVANRDGGFVLAVNMLAQCIAGIAGELVS